MNEALIANWNGVVAKGDTVYVVGDLSFERDSYKVAAMVGQLKGRKHLIRGNHDKHLDVDVMLTVFDSVSDIKEVKVPNGEGGHQLIVLCHYALKVWNASHYASWHCFGHSHGNVPDDPDSLSLDVGVDCWNYTPVSFEQIKERMALKTFKPIDGHSQRR